MSNWNRAYLDALEVPVWVPLSDTVNDSTPTKVQQPASLKADSLGDSAEPGLRTESYQLISGNINADIVFVVPSDINTASIDKTLKQLQFAWKAWTEQPFSAAVIQETQSHDPSIDLDTVKGKLIDCRQDVDKLETPSIAAPHFDLNQASKKDWWWLLQRLYQ